jgi:hypothetical protein
VAISTVDKLLNILRSISVPYLEPSMIYYNNSSSLAPYFQ